MADQNITSNEYQQYMALRDQINKGVEEADSEFMLTTYSQLRRVMVKRQAAANRLNIQLENKAMHATAKTKREEMKAKKKAEKSA